jgi:hypothetical protein
MPRSFLAPEQLLMQSKATTVEKYLAELPADRRAAIEAVRRVIRDNLDSGYQEGMQYGMISYFVPHARYPAGYHCDPQQPLCFVGLASQKNHMSLYMMCQYVHSKNEKSFRAAWAKTGKKLDMGKSCIRFKRVGDLALDLIGEAVRATPVDKHVEFYEAAIKPRQKKPKKEAPAAKGGKKGTKARRAPSKTAAILKTRAV